MRMAIAWSCIMAASAAFAFDLDAPVEKVAGDFLFTEGPLWGGRSQAACFWSSTSSCNRPQQAWFIDFATGLVSHADKPQQYLVLAVRSGVAVPRSKIKAAPDPRLFAESGEGGGLEGGKGKDGKKKRL